MPCGLASFTNLTRVVDFSACSVFYLLLALSGSFQAASVLDQKLEVWDWVWSSSLGFGVEDGWAEWQGDIAGSGGGVIGRVT